MEADANFERAAPPLLTVTNLNAFYGQSQALRGVSLSVRRGEIVTLIGRNGAGKSTTLKSIMGMLPSRTGSIEVMGTETIGLSPEQVARLGIAYCPEERGIYSSLSVEENLLLPPVLFPGGMSIEEIVTLFPNLRERMKSQGTKLSGGEQQMLAIARILRTGCKLLLLDEPTEGLAPVIVAQIRSMLEGLRARGYTILLVEQNFQFAARVADRHYVVDRGQVVEEASAAQVASGAKRIEAHLGI